MANHRFALYRSYATIRLAASSACNDSGENWGDARAPLCFKVQKSSRTARSRRHGLSFRDRGRVIFPGCAARAALRATLEKGPTDGWNIGSNDATAIKCMSKIPNTFTGGCACGAIRYESTAEPVLML